MFDCNYLDRCLNKDKCMRCRDESLLKLPEDKKRLYMQQKAKHSSKKTDTKLDSKESWNDMEQLVADKLNAVPTTKQFNDAKRQIRSGAISTLKGDVVDDFLLIECKERASTSNGSKSITIKKEWLDKIKEEAKSVDKLPCFCFRYKDDETIYSIIDYDIISEIICNLKYVMEELDRLSNS